MHPRGTQPLLHYSIQAEKAEPSRRERGLSNLHLTLDAFFKLNLHALTRHRVCFIGNMFDVQLHLKIFTEPDEEAFNKRKSPHARNNSRPVVSQIQAFSHEMTAACNRERGLNTAVHMVQI